LAQPRRRRVGFPFNLLGIGTVTLLAGHGVLCNGRRRGPQGNHQTERPSRKTSLQEGSGGGMFGKKFHVNSRHIGILLNQPIEVYRAYARPFSMSIDYATS